VKLVSLAAPNTCDWEPKDSLAAKRISTTCHRDTCYRNLIQTPSQCRCTIFLTKPTHSCEKGEFHFCKECYKAATYEMGHSNTKEITFRTVIGGNYSLTVRHNPPKIYLLVSNISSQQYTCPAGHPCDCSPARCKLCLGTCAKAVVNNLESPYKVNGGGEGGIPGWNNGVCPWIFNLLSGMEGSFDLQTARGV
jgi:hypothetical protein